MIFQDTFGATDKFDKESFVKEAWIINCSSSQESNLTSEENWYQNSCGNKTKRNVGDTVGMLVYNKKCATNSINSYLWIFVAD